MRSAARKVGYILSSRSNGAITHANQSLGRPGWRDRIRRIGGPAGCFGTKCARER
jgi:hypothetical protein